MNRPCFASNVPQEVSSAVTIPLLLSYQQTNFKVINMVTNKGRYLTCKPPEQANASVSITCWLRFTGLGHGPRNYCSHFSLDFRFSVQNVTTDQLNSCSPLLLRFSIRSIVQNYTIRPLIVSLSLYKPGVVTGVWDQEKVVNVAVDRLPEWFILRASSGLVQLILLTTSRVL